VGFIKELDKKTKIYIFLIVLVTVVMWLLYGYEQKSQNITVESLKRPEYGEESATLPVSIWVEEVSLAFDTSIELRPQQYDINQAQKYVEEVKEKIPEHIIGKNMSFDRVESNLNLINEIPEYPVSIKWYSDNYELVDNYGNVNPGETGGTARLTAVLTCCDYSSEYIIEVNVAARQIDEAGQMLADIKKQIELAQNDGEEYVSLPEVVDGKNITYMRQNGSKQTEVIPLLGLAAVAAVAAGDFKQKKSIKEKRHRQMQYDYSEVVSKLTLLIGAGMTVRKAWERIVNDYKLHREEKGVRYIYEEMAESYNQLKTGIPESVVYERFGQRCGLKEYLKFSSLICQNLKKGTKDLVFLLELETAEAFENRKNLARKYGEEAGTKLLVPMVLMLIIVMVIVMVPALMSFGV